MNDPPDIRRRTRSGVLPLTLLLVYFGWSSFYGLNFGVHWDETRAKFDSVGDTLKTGLFFQGAGGNPSGFHYNYGGVNYLLTWAGFTPEVVRFLRTGPLDLDTFSKTLTPLVYDIKIRMRVRAIYLVLSSLSIVWLYCLSRVLGRKVWESFLAAAILAGSWEVAYHSRWIAPDAVMMQFALLSFLCLAMGLKTNKRFWLYAAACAAGLTAGTKYTGGLVLPFILAGATCREWLERRTLLPLAAINARLCAAAAVTFVITTPGVLLDPFHFVAQLREQQTIYATGWYGYSVVPGIPHLFAILKYVALQIFSHYWSLSVPLAMLALFGFASLLRDRERIFYMIVTGFVLTYVLYFSLQAALLVRNLLVVVPFLCFACARGISALAEILPAPARAGIYGLVGVVLATNLGWEAYTARQIKRRLHPEDFAKQFEKYAEKSPSDTFLISAGLAKTLESFQATGARNIVTRPSIPHTKVAFLQSEGADTFWETWPHNWWSMYEAAFGPLEVNLNAYPTFVGNQRILVVSAANFAKLPLKLTEIPAAPAPVQ